MRGFVGFGFHVVLFDMIISNLHLVIIVVCEGSLTQWTTVVVQKRISLESPPGRAFLSQILMQCVKLCVSCDLKTLVNESTGCRDWQEVFEQDIYYIHEIMNSVTPTQSLDTSSCGSQVGAPPTKHWFCPYNRTTTLGNFGASKIWFDIPNIVNNQVAQGQQ